MVSLRKNKTICCPVRVGMSIELIVIADFTGERVVCVRHMAAKHQNRHKSKINSEQICTICTFNTAYIICDCWTDNI